MYQLVQDLLKGSLTGEELMQRYCSLIYCRSGSYEEAARRGEKEGWSYERYLFHLTELELAEQQVARRLLRDADVVLLADAARKVEAQVLGVTLDAGPPQRGLDLRVHLRDVQLVDQVVTGQLGAAPQRRLHVLYAAGHQHHVLAGVYRAREDELGVRLPEHRVGNLDAARRYLEWELGLVDQLDADERSVLVPPDLTGAPGGG